MKDKAAEDGPAPSETGDGRAEDRVFDLTAQVGWTNRLVISFSQEDLRVQRGFLVWQRMPWDSIAGITLGRMAAEIVTHGGKVRVIHFGLLGFADNQEVKPQVLQTLRAFAQARGISVTEEAAA